MSGGLHAVLELGEGERAPYVESRVIARSTECGLGAVPLSGYWQRHSHATERFGLVIGTGGPDSVQFERALDTLREIIVEEIGAGN